MTLDQILTLLEAGYTREEINEMRDLQTPEPEPTPNLEPEPEPEPQPEPTPDPELQKDPDPTPAYITSLMKSIDKLTKTLQISNRNGAEGAGGTEKSADDVIKDVIGTMTGKKGDNK